MAIPLCCCLALRQALQRLRYAGHDRHPPRVSPRPTAPTPAASCALDDAGATARLAGWVHRRRDHGQLIFLDLRDRHGITQVVIDKADAPEAHATASRIRPEFVVSVAGTVAPRLPGTENTKLADRRHRAPGDRGRDPVRGEDPAVLHQRAGRPRRREPAPQVPLPRHPPGADAAAADAPQPDGPGDPRGPPRQRVRRGRDADPDQEHARGRPRLHRPEPAPAGDRLRAAAEPAAAQAAADGRRASTATCRSPAAIATRTCAATASPSSPSSTSR